MRVSRAAHMAAFLVLGALSLPAVAETDDKATPPANAHDTSSATQPNMAPSAEQPPVGATPVAGFTEAQRKGMITANIAFGRDEADGFWPLYRDYRRDVGKLLERRAKAIAQYTEIFRTMTGDQAKSLLEDVLQSDEDIAKVKRDYLKKFRKFLPDTKVTRFYLIDAKIDLADEAMLMTKVQTVGEAPR